MIIYGYKLKKFNNIEKTKKGVNHAEYHEVEVTPIFERVKLFSGENVKEVREYLSEFFEDKAPCYEETPDEHSCLLFEDVFEVGAKDIVYTDEKIEDIEENLSSYYRDYDVELGHYRGQKEKDFRNELLKKVEESENELRELAKDFDNIYYLVIVDREGRIIKLPYIIKENKLEKEEKYLPRTEGKTIKYDKDFIFDEDIEAAEKYNIRLDNTRVVKRYKENPNNFRRKRRSKNKYHIKEKNIKEKQRQRRKRKEKMKEELIEQWLEEDIEEMI